MFPENPEGNQVIVGSNIMGYDIRPSLWPIVVSVSALDGTGCEFDSWQCRIYIPCSLSLRLLGSLRGSLGTYGLTQKLSLKKYNNYNIITSVFLFFLKYFYFIHDVNSVPE